MNNLKNANNPLCVDLDGTLVRTDTLVESFFCLLRVNFLYIIIVPFWIIRGKAVLKEEIAKRIELDAKSLPYQDEFLSFLREEHTKGRQLILATAANHKIANAIAKHLGIFETVISSNLDENISGKNKLSKIRQILGDKPFDYAGNSQDDVDILTEANNAILVNPSPGVFPTVEKCTNVQIIFRDNNSILTYLRALRTHQWLKNILLFVPLIAAHEFSNTEVLFQIGLAFLSFCLCASSVYILNDMIDLPDDRSHPRKAKRPFASGDLSITHGALLIPVLLFSAFLIAWFLPPMFLLVLVTYYVSTLLYSFWLKRIVLVDVFTLASLYTIRVLAGAAATSITPSFWLLVFSMFIFLSLAMVKRYSELKDLPENHYSLYGRGYNVADLEIVSNSGMASGYLAVLVLALYIHSPDIENQYQIPEVIWLVCILLLYWVSRMWLIAQRGLMHDDPLIFALKDYVSRWIAVITAVLLWLAI
jgi:4-hydroxybenzoate polyprenyltransferase